MNLYTFSRYHNQDGEGKYCNIYQVIAQNEDSARLYLAKDGHTGANSPVIFQVESVFELKNIPLNSDAGIACSFEFEFTD